MSVLDNYVVFIIQGFGSQPHILSPGLKAIRELLFRNRIETHDFTWRELDHAYDYWKKDFRFKHIIIVSHSYGCSTARKLIYKLYREHICKVRLWCAIDYVPSNWIRNILSFLGFRRKQVIPRYMVHRIINFYQREKGWHPTFYPQGRILIDEVGAGWENIPIHKYNHVEIDDAPMVISTIIDAIDICMGKITLDLKLK